MENGIILILLLLLLLFNHNTFHMTICEARTKYISVLPKHKHPSLLLTIRPSRARISHSKNQNIHNSIALLEFKQPEKYYVQMKSQQQQLYKMNACTSSHSCQFSIICLSVCNVITVLHIYLLAGKFHEDRRATCACE